MKEVVITVDDVSFRYKGQTEPALQHISFEINKGDFAAVIGPNGSGKTTLIKIILGIFAPDKGQISVLGTPIEKLSQRTKLGYVPQTLATFDPNFPASVSEIVRMGLVTIKENMHHHEEEKRVQEALQTVGMNKFSERKISELSGGQQQRVMIARALVARPAILILDEPTAEVDIHAQRKFYALLKKLNKEKITIMLVTHDIGILNKHISKVICVNKEMLCYGTPKKTLPKIKKIFQEEKVLEHHHP